MYTCLCLDRAEVSVVGEIRVPTVMNFWSTTVTANSSLATMWSHKERMYTFLF